jgi:Kdo2-lipid IVA lauroyltransferase/acyltransferase
LKKKSKILIFIEYIIALPIVVLFRIMPVSLAYKFSSFLMKIVFTLDKKHKNRVVDHLIFAGVCANKEEALRIARKHSVHIGQLLTEIAKMKQIITPENVEEYASFGGSQKGIDCFFNPPKSGNAIVLSAHYGNWEIAANIYALKAKKHLLSVMRAIDNPLIGKMIYNQRVGFNTSICPKEGAMKHLIKSLRNGDSICMVVDQHAGRNDGIETQFFGKAVRTHISPALLHLKTGVPILVGISKRIGIFKFKMYIADPIIVKPTDNKEADILKITQAYTTALEKLIKEHGVEQWMWAHRRWLDLRKKTVRSKTVEVSNG